MTLTTYELGDASHMRLADTMQHVCATWMQDVMDQWVEDNPGHELTWIDTDVTFEFSIDGHELSSIEAEITGKLRDGGDEVTLLESRDRIDPLVKAHKEYMDTATRFGFTIRSLTAGKRETYEEEREERADLLGAQLDAVLDQAKAYAEAEIRVQMHRWIEANIGLQPATVKFVHAMGAQALFLNGQPWMPGDLQLWEEYEHYYRHDFSILVQMLEWYAGFEQRFNCCVADTGPDPEIYPDWVETKEDVK